MSWWGYKPYVSVAQRQAKAKRHAAGLAKKGQACCPIHIEGLKIAKTFWGKAWCDHLESYSDFSNRLPRGRTYVRNGSVIDLQIAPGKVRAIVCGSDIYNVKIDIKPLAAPAWKGIKGQCAGQISSLVELLQGKLSKGVMEIITCKDKGMFPAPVEISLDCSCPDWADMCKHVAAVLYGVGARLDEQPELLFTLRGVDHLDLIEQAGQTPLGATDGSRDRQTLAAGDLADVFGIELSDDVGATVQKQPSAGKTSRPKKLSPEKPATRVRGKEAKSDRAKAESAPRGKSKSVAKKK
jgi:uncharacterized Zn finger protein